MPTKAKAAKGTLLQRGDGGGTEVFTTIGEVTSFSGPGEEIEVIDATSFDSTFKEVIAGMPSVGDVSFDMLFVGSNAQQQGLRTDLRAGTLRNFKVVLNDHASSKTTFAFAAIVKSLDFDGGGATGDAYKAKCTLAVSGAATVTYAPA